MTIAEMRTLLGLADDVPDAEVVAAYAAHLEADDGPLEVEIEDLISLADVKKHLRVTHDDEDDLIRGYLAAAIGHIDGPDGWLGRAILPQTIVQRFDGFGLIPRRLPYPPLIEVIAVEGYSVGAWSAVAHVYDGELRPATAWPASAARVTYRAGYDGQPGRELPAAIRAAVLLMVGDLHKNRSGTASDAAVIKVPMSTTVEMLLAPYRVWSC